MTTESPRSQVPNILRNGPVFMPCISRTNKQTGIWSKRRHHAQPNNACSVYVYATAREPRRTVASYPTLAPRNKPYHISLATPQVASASLAVTSLVVPDQRPQRVPAVAVLIDVHHAAAQAVLQVLRVVAEEQHDHAPGERSKGRPGVVANLGAQWLARDYGEADARLDGETGESENNTSEDVDDNLLLDSRDVAGALGAPAEDDVAAEEAGEEGIVGA
jgi:hypothetical protein